MRAARAYWGIARRYPLGTLARLAGAKLSRDFRHSIGRWRARAQGLHLTPEQFRAALSPGFRNEAAVAAWMRGSAERKFFIDSARRDEIVNVIRSHFPQTERLTLEAANRACAHVFDLLGSGPTRLGESIDWHVDFKTGHRFDPHRYHADIRPAPYPGGYDIKVPWELSRCQHFAWLGQAYWFTGDEKYAHDFVAQVTNWIEQNPPAHGVNWTTSMEVAIRAVNWLWGLAYFRSSPALSDEFLIAVAGSLLAHGRHIAANLERHDTYTGNHYLADLVGLLHLGLMCPYLHEADSWREFGLVELWREMDKQVYADGVNFEASIGYHRLVTEFFAASVGLCELNGMAVPGSVRQRLEKMLEYVMYYTKPDGTAPLFGDFDNGRLVRLRAPADAQREWLDHRYLLAVGAVMFGRGDFAQAAGGEWQEAIWLLGGGAAERLPALAAALPEPLHLGSRAFADGGVYVMRNRDLYLAVDAGSHGQNGNGGHAHNDTLSFELVAAGATWISDGGTFTYTQDYEARQSFRSAALHNVLRLDDDEPYEARADQPFALVGAAEPRILAWEVEAQTQHLAAEHTPYGRWRPGLLHRRNFTCHLATRACVVQDYVLSQTPHRFALTLLMPECQLKKENSIVRATRPGCQAGLAIYWMCTNADVAVEIVERAFSPSYGCRLPAPALSITGSLHRELVLTGVMVVCAPNAWPTEADLRQIGSVSPHVLRLAAS